MSKGVDIVTLGYIFNEHIKTNDGVVSGPYLGGTESYGSIGLAKAGYTTGAVTNIGPDTEKELLEPFKIAGVDMAGFNVYPGESETKDLLCYFEDGTKEITYLKRAPRVMPQDIPEVYLKTMKVCMLCLVDYEVDTSTIKFIKNKCPDVIVSVDLGGTGGAHSTKAMRDEYIVANGGKKQKELIGLIDIGKMSLEDYICITGKADVSLREAAEDMLNAGLKIVIITLGGDGSYILTREGEEYRIPAVTPYHGVIDTTGAGDTYVCIFTAEYLKTGNIEKAAYFASATTSILIEKTGGASPQRCPSRKMIEERLKRFFEQND
jgi:sugar/nucleoside kinase (ribokinase family)